jgi:hypothetical protein
MSPTATSDAAMGTSDAAMAEKGHAEGLEDGSGSGSGLDAVPTKETNHHSWDNHTSFTKYPTHQPGYENKVSSLSNKHQPFILLTDLFKGYVRILHDDVGFQFVIRDR